MSFLHQQNPDVERLRQTLKSVALPALAGAAGGGALSTYLSSKSGDPDEDPTARRHRILRNALIGTALGGVAGGALPIGLGALAQPFGYDVGLKSPLSPSPGSGGEGVLDRVTSGLARHFIPAAVGGAGAVALSRSVGNGRAAAAKKILETIAGHPLVPPGSLNHAQLMEHLKTPEGSKNILAALADKLNPAGGNLADATMRARSWIHEAGGSGVPAELAGGESALRRFLTGSNVSAFGRSIPVTPSGAAAELIGKDLPFGLKGTTLADAAAKYLRPGVGKSLGGFRPVTKALGLGAAIYGANELQNKLEGN